MFNWFKKKLLTAPAAHSLYLKFKPFTAPPSRGNQKQLDQILNTIQMRAKAGHRVLWIKELSEDVKYQLQELEYKVVKTIDGDSYYIQW